MPLDIECYLELCDTFAKIKLFKEDRGLLPRVSSDPD